MAEFVSTGFGALKALRAAFYTNSDGSTATKTLTELGITEIKLTADATNIELVDSSKYSICYHPTKRMLLEGRLHADA